MEALGASRYNVFGFTLNRKAQRNYDIDRTHAMTHDAPTNADTYITSNVAYARSQRSNSVFKMTLMTLYVITLGNSSHFGGTNVYLCPMVDELVVDTITSQKGATVLPPSHCHSCHVDITIQKL